jgi:drug/metabolite transporter (DMT)-like permease
MTVLGHDVSVRAEQSAAPGFGFAALSAASFGLSGSLAAGLTAAGWSPAAAVTVRVLVAAAVLAWPACRSIRRCRVTVRRGLPQAVAYGIVAVAGCQLCYFYAVTHLEVGVALMIEYTAPVAVSGWLWLRRGERPSWPTIVGAVVAGGGLVLVLDLVSGAGLDPIGLLWALGAMVGAATYFVLSADESTGMPPLVLAATAMAVAGVILLLVEGTGLLPMRVSTSDVAFAVETVPWWLPVLGLGVITAAVAYSSGIAASRRLGSRLASFVALGEVLAALAFAWLLLHQTPAWMQLVGGALVLAGLVVIKFGEPPRSTISTDSARMSVVSARRPHDVDPGPTVPTPGHVAVDVPDRPAAEPADGHCQDRRARW